MKDCKGKGKGKKGGGDKGKGGKDHGKKGKFKGGGKDFGKSKGAGKKGKDAVCHNCGKPGHFKDQCRSKPKGLNAVEQKQDPRLSQLQSAYAKAAAEEFQRMTTAAPTLTAPTSPHHLCLRHQFAAQAQDQRKRVATRCRWAVWWSNICVRFLGGGAIRAIGGLPRHLPMVMSM